MHSFCFISNLSQVYVVALNFGDADSTLDISALGTDVIPAEKKEALVKATVSTLERSAGHGSDVIA